jgi:putative ABC transport system ATP-binding protein
VIELRSVSKTYGAGDTAVTALHDVTLTVTRGEFVAIVGPSGSGKSTLLNLIGCLDVPTSGHCLVLGNDTGGLDDATLSHLRNRSIGFVFQLFNLVPELTVRENIELPLVYAGGVRNRQELTTRALARVGLQERADHSAASLSGGEQQRVAVARALVNEPDIILADEPTGSIDADSGKAVLANFVELHRTGRTIVVVTHNPSVAEVADRIVQLVGGRLASPLPQRPPRPAAADAIPPGARPPAGAVRSS